MSYAETQDEIIRAQLRDRSPASPRLVTASSAPSAPGPLAPPPGPWPIPVPPAVTPESAPSAVAPRHDEDADADLAAAVAAARRLRFTVAVEQITSAAGVTVEQMQGRGKDRELVEVRRIVAAYLRRRGCSLPEIGRVLNRDHTSVLNMLRNPGCAAGLYERAS